MSAINCPDLARVTIESGIVKLGGPFKLKDGSFSPIYLNLRTPPKGNLTSGLVRQYVYEALWPLSIKLRLQFDATCGVPEAGDVFAEMFAASTRVPRILLDKQGEGDERRVVGLKDDGGIPRWKRVLVVDDLITRSRSKLEAIDVLRRGGYNVSDVLVLVDRDQGGREELAASGVKLHAVWTIDELLTFYRENNLMNQNVYDEVAVYLAASRS